MIVNAMTVDVEDYFHASAFDRTVAKSSWVTRESRVVRNTENLLECFDRAGVHGTFFILGWVAERFPQLVRDIAASGHELASHGFHHQLIYTLTPEQFRQDVRRTKRMIEDIAGCEVRGYRAPSFSIVKASLWALDVLIEEGHSYDASIFPIHHDRYGIPDAPRHPHVVERAAGTIVEVPASTLRVFQQNVPIAGGGYFRLVPYEWTRWAMARVNRDGEPVVFYLHPWEIDPDQPRLPVSRTTAFRHYCGLGKTLNRLELLCNDFAFGTVAAMLTSQPAVTLPAMPRLAHAK
ncbi:MAG TPA: XrtA system polysaccharide deacetylase [Vicinamibacterales bacterium]|nr:XrtA system polysaccharide deacetylase [Vicinamibacterales bacterium]